MAEVSQDVLDILSDDQYRAALQRKRAMLADQLAEACVDRSMPDFEEYPDDLKEAIENRIELFARTIRSIDDRLKTAGEALRAIRLVTDVDADVAPHAG